jgi:hypothetical protein
MKKKASNQIKTREKKMNFLSIIIKKELEVKLRKGKRETTLPGGWRNS